MSATSAEQLHGFEFDWLASDADGNVALFSTGGSGYAPEELVRDTDAHDAAIDAILAVPAMTSARLAPQLPPGLPNTWHLVAERGLFAFDCAPPGTSYRLVAAPAAAIRVADLPGPAAVVAGRLVFPHLRFATLTELTEAVLRR